MALPYDWQNQSHLAPSPYPVRGGGGGGMGGGMQLPLNKKPLPGMPDLSIPGLAPMPNLPQFDNSFPGLQGPNLPNMQVPQLQTRGLGLPEYQRPQYNDMSGGYAGLSNQLMQMMGIGPKPQGGQNGQVTSAIDASPLFTSSFGGAPKGPPGLGQAMPYMNKGQQGAAQGRFNENAGRLSQQNNTALDRGAAQANAGFGLQAQGARADSGLGLMGLLTGMFGDQVGAQNQQEDALLRFLSQLGAF